MIKTKKKAFAIAIMLLIASLLIAYVNTDKTNLSYWYQDFVRKNEPYTLLLGSSSILRIPSDLLVDCKKPVIYGFNNGTTETIESYLLHANFKNASKVVLYIGENDIAQGERPEITFNQLKAIVTSIEAKTEGPIGIVKLKYSPARANEHTGVLGFNKLLEEHYDDKQFVQLIPFDEIMGVRWFISDGIHLNDKGNRQFSQWINDFCRTE